MHTLITGGTGFVGRELLSRVPQPVVITRNASSARQQSAIPDCQFIEWEGPASPLDLSAAAPYGSVINLMGESIATGRWSAEKKRRIVESRVAGTRRLVDAILQCNSLPSVMVSASAIGFYGDPGDSIVDERHGPGAGFLPEVCQQWEAEANRLTEFGVRVVCLRIGIVIGKTGGAIKEMLPLFRTGLGGRLGSGRQWMSWIHVDDLVSMIRWAVAEESVSGAVNATAPNPVCNRDFTRSLARAVHRPAILPVPRFGLRLILGEFADSLYFSQRIVPQVALTHGFEFRFPDIDSAINNVV